MTTKALLLVLAAGTLMAPALAQQAPTAPPAASPAAAAPLNPAQPPAAPAAPKAPPSFTDEEFAAIARLLTGCWKASIPGAGEVVMGVAPVHMKGMTDCFYSELSRGDALHRPFRQAILQLHKVNGKVRLKTLEFRSPGGKADHVAGLWAAPDAFPAMSMDDLVATMDVELTKDGGGYRGRTLNPYPTTIGGAIEMTGEVRFDGNSFWTADRGFDKDGKQVWGPAAGDGYTFGRFDGGPRTLRLDGGVIVIDYPATLQGNAATAGQMVSVEYMGYTEAGRMFDASYERGSPFTFAKGDPRLTEGWARAMEDARKGQVRRVIIPASAGSVGKHFQGRVPPNTGLIYDVKVVDVSSVAPAPAPARPGPKLEPVDPNDPAIRKMQERVLEDHRRREAEKNARPAEPANPAPPAPK